MVHVGYLFGYDALKVLVWCFVLWFELGDGVGGFVVRGVDLDGI